MINPEAYSQPNQTSEMELFAKTVNCRKPLTMFTKNLGCSSCEYASKTSCVYWKIIIQFFFGRTFIRLQNRCVKKLSLCNQLNYQIHYIYLHIVFFRCNLVTPFCLPRSLSHQILELDYHSTERVILNHQNKSQNNLSNLSTVKIHHELKCGNGSINNFSFFV